MKTVYLIYFNAPKKFYNDHIRNLIGNSDKTIFTDTNRAIGLYAWTTNKEYYEEFIDFRHNDNLFVVKEKKLDKEGISSLKDDNFTEKIDLYPVPQSGHDTNPLSLLLTKNEKIQISDYFNENFYETLPDWFGFDYMLFKDKFIDALDALSYTSYFDIYSNSMVGTINEEEAESRCEYANSMLGGYNKTVYGRDAMTMDGNELGMFILLFNTMLSYDGKD